MESQALEIFGEGKRPTRYINHDHHNYVERCSSHMGKKGVLDKTDASHIFSWSLYNVFATHMKKRKIMTEVQFEVFCCEMNQAANLRIKSVKGNRVTDEFRDFQIADAYVNGLPIKSSKAIKRASRAYQVGSQFTSSHALAVIKELGAMTAVLSKDGILRRVRDIDI